jgi:hypothetical protein
VGIVKSFNLWKKLIYFFLLTLILFFHSFSKNCKLHREGCQKKLLFSSILVKYRVIFLLLSLKILRAMDIQIASDIKDLLMEDGTAIVPGLGGFTSTYKPAVTDGVMGVLHPPTYHLAFDPHQQTNDGKLIEFIREKYHVSSTTAQEAIDVFVKDTQGNFEKNEIVIMPEIGRLYRDFTQKIQFLPEATNFNAETFGLSSINFSPISRTKYEPTKSTPVAAVAIESTVEATLESTLEAMVAAEPVIKAQPSYKEKVEVAFLTPVDDVPPPSIIKKSENPTWLPDNWRDYAPALAVALISILAILVWMNTSNSGKGNTEGVKKLENEKPKINVSPHDNAGTTANTEVAPSGNPPQQPILPPQTGLDSPTVSNQQVFEDKRKQETVTSSKPDVFKPESAHKATIVIGGFANKDNIVRLKKWISAQGYGIYEKKKSSGLTEVGCEVGYESPEELARMLTKIKARYGNEIDVYKK